MRHAVLWVTLFGVWLLLVWPAGPGPERFRIENVAAGAAAALLCAAVMRRLVATTFRPWLNPMRYVWLVAYGVVLAGSIVKANLDVAYRVLHPAMPIRPGIVKVRTRLKSAAAIAVLANSITLTPGTLTVNATTDGVLYIHWIWVRATDVEEASRQIVGLFEWFITRIWE